MGELWPTVFALFRRGTYENVCSAFIIIIVYPLASCMPIIITLKTKAYVTTFK